ncbi:MAG TPA: hypothetical protein VJM33_01275 [Microthrixaceae bacterium]|nr:hypothetical protein [Microthrixaceae bacterium]
MAHDERPRSVDLATLGQTHFDSAMPSGSAVVGHPLPAAGDYVVSRLEGRSLVRTHAMAVRATVDDDTNLGRMPAPALQFADEEVRLPSVGRTLAAEEIDALRLREGGVASFTGAAGTEHTARIQQVSKAGRATTVWDSTKLVAGDLYALSIGRPGTYRMRNSADGSEATVVVTYPVRGKRGYRPAAPVTVRCTERGFDAKEVTIGPLQGLVVQVEAPARVVIDLVEADDGPERDKPRARVDRRAQAARAKTKRRVATLHTEDE